MNALRAKDWDFDEALRWDDEARVYEEEMIAREDAAPVARPKTDLPAISIVGLGYVGAVSTACLASLGHPIVGVDVDTNKVSRIAAGETPIHEAELGDFGKGQKLPMVDLIDEMVDLLRPFAEELGSVAEVEHARTMVRRGSSADFQLRVFNEALAGGASDHEAKIAVVDWLISQSAGTAGPGVEDAAATA